MARWLERWTLNPAIRVQFPVDANVFIFIFYTRTEIKLFFTKFSLSITLESLFTLILHFTSLLENCIFPVIVYIQSGH